MQFIIYFILVFSLFPQTSNPNADTAKKLDDLEKEIEENKNRIKKSEELLRSIKTDSNINASESYKSPMKEKGLDGESMRSLLLMPEHQKFLRNNQNLWLNDNLRVGFMIRPRFEERQNLDFSNKTADETSRIMQASQLWFLYDPNPYLTMKITIQDARIWGGSTPAQTGDRQYYFANSATLVDPTLSNKTVVQNNTDVREAFMILKSPEIPLKAIIGRQIIALGDQRMMGGANWNTNGLSFDGVRFVFDYKILNISAFGVKTSAGQDGPNGLLTSNGRKNGNLDDSYLYGVYNTLNFGFVLIDFYSLNVLKKYIPKTASYSGENLTNDDVISTNRSRQYDNLITNGVRITNRTSGNNLPKGNYWDYTFEFAGQSGLNGQRIYASWDQLKDETTGMSNYTERVKYAGRFFVFQTGYTFFEKFRAGIQYLNASGDNNRNDGSSSTFQTLPGPRFSVFPIWNSFVGQSENVGMKNLRSYSVNLSYNSNMGTFVLAGFINNKDKKEDAYYAISGVANTGATGSCSENSATVNNSTENCSGNSYSNKNYLGRTLYREIDLTWMYYWRDGVSFMAGASVLHGGDALRNTRENITSSDIYSRYTFKPTATIFYFMVTAAL
jgi:hypothetical protein